MNENDILLAEALDLPSAAVFYVYGALIQAACDGVTVTPDLLRLTIADALAVTA